MAFLVSNGKFVKTGSGGSFTKATAPQLTELCFTANTAGSTVELCIWSSLPSISNTSYSRDRVTWTTFTPGITSEGTNVITLTNAGDKVYFRNDVTGDFSSTERSLNFVMTGSIAASGNVNSMYVSTGFNDLTTLIYKGCFGSMFYGCTSLTTAPILPATTLSQDCYGQMFYGCTSLITPPQLPASTLARYCYANMFSGCTSLTTAPELPATTLSDSCYSNMFSGCTSLTIVPALSATTLTEFCYMSMFWGCTSLQVSDTQVTEALYVWNIPKTGTFTNWLVYDQYNMFTNCLGTRSSNTMSGAPGTSHTYYTQNQPV